MDDGIRLPYEVLAHIFSFLHPRDKLKALSVCQRWRNVFNEYPDLLKDLCVCVLPSTIEDILTHSVTVTRKFSYFKFEAVNIDEERFHFLHRCCPQFRCLIFVNCKILVNVELGPKPLSCERLLKLTILDCGSIGVLNIFDFLPELKNLYLKFLRFSEKDIEQMQELIPLTLTELRLAEVLPTAEAQKIVVAERIVDFICKRLLSLKSLDLRLLNCQGLVMHKLSKIEGSSLKRLEVFSNSLPHRCIEHFCNHHQNIVTLNLTDDEADFTSFRRKSRTSIITDSTVVAICNSLPLLEELDISYCIGVNESVAMIFKLKRLRRLSLNGCYGITDNSLMNASKGLACENLRILDMRGTYIQKVTMSSFLDLIPNLREITLSNSHCLNSEWVERLPRRSGADMTFVPRST